MSTSKLPHTVKQYLELPLNEREKRVWFWPFKWYQEPYALELDQWDKFNKYTKKNYPVQHFLREEASMWLYILDHRLRDVKYTIKNYIINPRKELRAKTFPPRYQDLDAIIVAFCLECIVEYVDREKCFENIVWDSDEEHIQRARMIKEVYAYAKTGRKALLQEIEDTWTKFEYSKAKGITQYDAINIKEQEIADLDTKYCTWVVSNRDGLWT